MNAIFFSLELWMLATATVFLIRAMTPSKAGHDHPIALVMAAIAVGVSLAALGFSGDLFAGTYRIDLFSQCYKCLLSVGLFLVVCLCGDLRGIRDGLQAEFYLLLAVTTLAMMMLVSSAHLLTVYMALELSSYSLYILVALGRDRDLAIKSGLKYFLVGASASAVMLFGMAMLYGIAGSAYLGELSHVLPPLLERPAAAIGLLLTLGGFFFKLAVFPFHFWAPVVYAGAANQVATYIATVSKVAAIAILIRVAALGSTTYIIHVLAILSIVSMTVGNLAAIVQKDLKRLLAYSSVAHGGYVLIGILCMGAAGYAAATFYALAILVMKFTCFMVVVKVAGDGRNPTVADLAGLHQRAPLLAMALMMALFGLAGIPPTIGFTGKLLLFNAAMTRGYLALILIAMINVVISLYYYLQVLRAAYLLEPAAEAAPAYHENVTIKLLSVILIAAMVIFGIYPQHLIQLANRAVGI